MILFVLFPRFIIRYTLGQWTQINQIGEHRCAPRFHTLFDRCVHRVKSDGWTDLVFDCHCILQLALQSPQQSQHQFWTSSLWSQRTQTCLSRVQLWGLYLGQGAEPSWSESSARQLWIARKYTRLESSTPTHPSLSAVNTACSQCGTGCLQQSSIAIMAPSAGRPCNLIVNTLSRLYHSSASISSRSEASVARLYRNFSDFGGSVSLVRSSFIRVYLQLVPSC